LINPVLARIEDALHRLDRLVLLRALRPGLSAAEVRGQMGSVGLASTAGLDALYGWHDGTSTEGVAALGDIYMFPGFYQLSIEDAIANYRAFVPDERWAAGWMPIFADGGGDFYVVDLGSPAEPPVRRFRLEESEHPIEFRSLDAMLMTLAASFERSVFLVGSNGYLEADTATYDRLAAELNPTVAWWRD
jgi:hypothetical protein